MCTVYSVNNQNAFQDKIPSQAVFRPVETIGQDNQAPRPGDHAFTLLFSDHRATDHVKVFYGTNSLITDVPYSTMFIVVKM